jgi:hypothetical protein
VNGLPNSTYVTLNVNNVSQRIAVSEPYSAWYDKGQTLNPNTNQTVMSFFRFANWRNSTGSVVARPMTVIGPEDYTAFYSVGFPLGIPGFPMESIFMGLVAGLLATVFKKKKRRVKKSQAGRRG